jgi:hypothetical protein
MKYLESQPTYELPARVISGPRDEKLDQLDEAIQELLDIKLLECGADYPNVRFVAVPRRSHVGVMVVTILALLALLAWLLGGGVVRPGARRTWSAAATHARQLSTDQCRPVSRSVGGAATRFRAS